MFGLGKKNPIAEHEATGDIDRVYHEIKQTFRVSGVNLNFRTWAKHQGFLPMMWDSMSSMAETRAFENAADRVRTDAARAAHVLGPIKVRPDPSLGPSQSFHVRGALDLYHYVNPKLLVLTSVVEMSLLGDSPSDGAPASRERIATGIPADMHAMEMESDEPDDEALRALYSDIKQTLSLPAVNSDYRTLALWPSYLTAAWQALKPIVNYPQYQLLADQLRATSRTLARELPFVLPMDLQDVRDAGAEPDQVLEVTESFSRILPGLIINMALLQLEYRQGSELADSPFPAPPRRTEQLARQ